jgi:hypothetical protein
MQIFIKRNSIERKAKIGSYLMYGGAGILILTFIFSLSYPQSTAFIGISALIAFLLSQYGIILRNRWGRRPRIDEIIDQSLKGLDSNYTLFHYELGANHVLISPAGIFTLVPTIHDGKITYEDNNWWQIKKKRRGESKRKQNKLSSDADLEFRALTRSLQKKLPDQVIPEPKPILVFLHPDAIVQVEHAPIFASHGKKLKSFIRKLDRSGTLDELQIDLLAESSGF